MTKNLCGDISCRNYGKYCRVHMADEEKQMKVDTKEYLKVRAEFLKANPTCTFGSCKKPATEVHHKKGRGKKYLCDAKTFLAVCPGHHRFITDHPHHARENGYSLSRLSNLKEK
jgi:hypothetical protein